MREKTMRRIDLALAAGGILAFALAFFAWNSCRQDAELNATSALFGFESANAILIDDNIEFNSPEKIEVKDGALINSGAGVHFWKILGNSSRIVQFTTDEEIEFRLKKNQDGYEVVNSGGRELDVGVYERGRLTGRVVLSAEGKK